MGFPTSNSTFTYQKGTKNTSLVDLLFSQDIQHGPRFKAAHKPLVKTLSSFENMDSHGEPIKPILFS
jgi:hypothetical protein